MSFVGMGQIASSLSPGNCVAAGGVYDDDAEICTSGTAAATGSTATIAGPNLANPDAGTFEDVNCPWWCWVLGNGIDTAVSSACFPCGNVCPAGTIWDTTNNVCSKTPVTSNTSTPSAGPAVSTTTYITMAIAAAALLFVLVKK